MFFADSLKQIVHVAPRSVNNDGVAVFGTPVEYNVNCYNILPMTSSADVTSIGTSVFERKRLVGDPEYLKNIKVLDKVYVNTTPPVTSDSLALGADFIVYSIDKTPMSCSILIKRLPESNI